MKSIEQGMWKDNTSIQIKFFRNMIVITLASIGLWSLIWIQGEYSAFKMRSESIRAAYVESQKTLLKNEVADVVRHISRIRRVSAGKLKDTLKERVYEAHHIAMNIYRENVSSRELPEIGKMIRDALRAVRFNDGRGYYFAVSMDGVEQLYPVKPEFEGKDVIDLQDSMGNFVIKEEMEVIRKNWSEGFVTHFWTQPEKDPARMYSKISFVKYFEPLDWYFGAGDYLDDFDEEVKKEVLSDIVGHRYGIGGYFFGSTLTGDGLFTNGNISRGTGSILNLTDPEGVKIIQEQLKAAENPDGGFVYYSWKKLSTEVPTPKMSFVKAIPEWGWMLGAGVYLDTIEETLSNNKAVFIGELQKKIIRSVFVLAILFCMVIFWTKRISNQIQKSAEIFLSMLKRANTELIALDPTHIQLKEFRDIAVSANEILEDRRRAEEALIESEKKFRSIFENGVEGFFQSTPEGVFTRVNPAFAKMFGYTSPKELISEISNIAKEIYVNDEDRCRYKQLLGKAGYVEEFEFRARCKDGSYIWVSDNTRAICDEHGTVIRFEGNVSDITERKQAETERLNLQAQLQQAQKMEAIGTLAGGIAHDFNNILAAILGYSEIARDELSVGDPIRKDLDLVIRSCDRAADLVNQILTFSRQGEDDCRPLKIQFILKEVLKLLRATLPATIELKENISVKCGSILADPNQIHQVMMNLCTNAKAAIGEKIGALSVSLSEIQINHSNIVADCPELPYGTYIDLDISDTGSGMDGLTRSKIFDPFFTTKEKEKGTGLGLAVVHGIIKQHKGGITVASEPGQGTTFHVYIPVVEKVAHVEQVEIVDELRGSERILLVEDEALLAEMIERMLHSLGYTVSVFTSSLEALSAYEINPDNFDLVITDMTMPEMTGTDLTKKILALRPELPVILCTGFSETVDEAKAKTIGIREYLLKPVDKHVLAKIVKKALRPN